MKGIKQLLATVIQRKWFQRTERSNDQFSKFGKRCTYSAGTNSPMSRLLYHGLVKGLKSKRYRPAKNRVVIVPGAKYSVPKTYLMSLGFGRKRGFRCSRPVRQMLSKELPDYLQTAKSENLNENLIILCFS